MTFDWLDAILFQTAQTLGVETFDLNPVLAVILVGLTCGMVGSLVVGSRMAFFSDAMAHTAFAGVALALLGVVVLTGVKSSLEADKFLGWVVPLVMGGIGAIVGLAIAIVRERTGLTNDTVIGVFFALAVGVGAMVLPEIRSQVQIDPDQFLFGSVSVTSGADLALLFLLTVLTAVVVGLRFNAIVFASFNPSLARSRGIPLRFNNYLFIVLLALVVNLSIKAVGVLLVNALLVVPAAAAANLGANLRQVFWLTLLGCVGSGLIGQQLSQHVRISLGAGRILEFGPGGTIVVVAVAWFFLTVILARLRGRTGSSRGDSVG